LLIVFRRLASCLNVDPKGAEKFFGVGLRTLATPEQSQNGCQRRRNQQNRIESLAANDHSASNNRIMQGL